MVDLVATAEELARRAHANQRYGSQSYADGHLAPTVEILRSIGADDNQLAAGWLHDIIEDCGFSTRTLIEIFNPEIAGLVWACTALPDQGRIQQMISIYAKIDHRPYFATVKCADRLANVRACKDRPDKASIYLLERSEFDHNVARYVPDLRPLLEAAYTDLLQPGGIDLIS